MAMFHVLPSTALDCDTIILAKPNFYLCAVASYVQSVRYQTGPKYPLLNSSLILDIDKY